jgi:heptosyltransferase-2
LPTKRALVVRGGALGDFILTLPVVRALRTEFGQVNVLANGNFAELIGRSNVALDDPQLARFFANSDRLPERWRAFFAQHDLVVSYLHDPEKQFEANVRACGVSNYVRGPWRMRAGSHATEQLARPLHQLGMAIGDFRPKLDVDKAHDRGRLIALHPGSGSPRKNWPVANWIALTNELLTAREQIVVIGGEADEREIAGFRAEFANRVSYALNRPLPELARLLRDNVFAGHDSGISHLAAAAGARCIVLFGPTDPEVWAPRGDDVRVLHAPQGDLRRLEVATVGAALPL